MCTILNSSMKIFAHMVLIVLTIIIYYNMFLPCIRNKLYCGEKCWPEKNQAKKNLPAAC